MVDEIVGLAGPESGKDVYAEERQVFLLAGIIMGKYSPAVSVKPMVHGDRLSSLRMSTNLYVPRDRDRHFSLSVNLFDLESNPEFRLTLKALRNRRAYHVRVNAERTDVDARIANFIASMGLPHQRRIFRSTYGETVGMDASSALEVLSQVTKATRPDSHNIMTDLTLDRIAPEDLARLLP